MNTHANKYLSTVVFLVKVNQLDLHSLFTVRPSWLCVTKENLYLKSRVWVFHLQTENRLGFPFYYFYSVYCNQTCSE